ncbi:MAG: hypothetical protein J5993_05695 [Clostridia bacterium]|nr:hypothetical protein [Clostridia bacterium]
MAEDAHDKRSPCGVPNNKLFKDLRQKAIPIEREIDEAARIGEVEP